MKLPFGCMRESYAGVHLEIDESVTYFSQTGMDLEITYLSLIVTLFEGKSVR